MIGQSNESQRTPAGFFSGSRGPLPARWPQLTVLPEPLLQEHYPWYYEQLKAGREVVVPSLDSLPEQAAVDRTHMVRIGIKSNLTLPTSCWGPCSRSC